MLRSGVALLFSRGGAPDRESYSGHVAELPHSLELRPLVGGFWLWIDDFGPFVSWRHVIVRSFQEQVSAHQGSE